MSDDDGSDERATNDVNRRTSAPSAPELLQPDLEHVGGGISGAAASGVKPATVV